MIVHALGCANVRDTRAVAAFGGEHGGETLVRIVPQGKWFEGPLDAKPGDIIEIQFVVENHSSGDVLIREPDRLVVLQSLVSVASVKVLSNVVRTVQGRSFGGGPGPHYSEDCVRILRAGRNEKGDVSPSYFLTKKIPLVVPNGQGTDEVRFGLCFNINVVVWGDPSWKEWKTKFERQVVVRLTAGRHRDMGRNRHSATSD